MNEELVEELKETVSGGKANEKGSMYGVYGAYSNMLNFVASFSDAIPTTEDDRYWLKFGFNHQMYRGKVEPDLMRRLGFKEVTRKRFEAQAILYAALGPARILGKLVNIVYNLATVPVIIVYKLLVLAGDLAEWALVLIGSTLIDICFKMRGQGDDS